MPFENVKYFLEILQILLDYFLFAVLTLMYHSTRGKRLQTTKGIKSCNKLQMCIELCTGVWKMSRHNRPGQWILLLRASNFSHGGGTPDFKWQGWSKDFFGFEFSISGFFRKENFGKLFFWVAWFKWGFFGVFKTNVCIFRVISFYAFWKFLWLGNSAWDVFGVKFWFRNFLGFVGSPRDFLGNF